GEVTDDLEYTVEAALLMSAMAFENGGLSIAHAMAAALAAAEGAREAAHGEHVAYGTLVQIEFEHRPEHEIEALSAFLRAVGLPVSLVDLGQDAGTAEVQALAAACVSAPYAHHHPAPVDALGIA